MHILFVTCPPDEAPALLRQLVEERLVAGGNILPGVRSIYRWKGEICDDPEVVMLIETAADRLEAAMERLAELHSYETPKILAFEPAAGRPDYLSWVHEMTRPQDR
jgi:periplasmic divalent cation tolerance protein